MELLLWRWSTAVQVTSMLMIAVFFAALSRSVRREELRLWLRAWLADLVALALALGFWYFNPDPRYTHVFFALYLGAKMSFVLFMLQGARVLRSRGGWLLRNEIALPLFAAFSIVSGMLIGSPDQLGLVAYPVMGLLFLAGGLPLVRPLGSGTAWLAAGFLTRAFLLFGETAVYVIRYSPEQAPSLQAPIRLFIAASSSFDSGAEWLIALGCVLAVSARIQRELRDSNSELLHAQALAEEANLSKSVFLANMSHELRTPLNAVIGFSQLVARSGSLSPEDRESVAIIRRSGEHLLGLINEVLSISKIEAGKLALERRPFDPREMIVAVASMIRGRASAAGIELTVDLDPGLPPAVLGDEGKLRQALLNLLGNAVKFTTAGSVAIHAQWSGGRGTFEVRDTGQGIAAAELPTLFEPFVQTESGRRAREGTGLGLAITRQLVHLMSGEITVTSRLGEGTTFRFDADLPLAAEPAHPAHVDRVVGLEATETRRRILVVDDTRDSRLLLRRLLEAVGLEVEEATNGAEAVEAWKAWHPELIFMDNRMPVMDGSQAAETIRELESSRPLLDRRPVVIVAVTASVFEHERGAILTRGADEVVMKPIDEEKIFDVIASRLGVRFRRESDPSPTPAPAAGSSILNVTQGLRRASGNAALYEELLRSFHNDYGDVATRLYADGGNREEVAMLLHSLRGSAATIGADDLAGETARLETSLRAGEPLALDVFSQTLAETLAGIEAYRGGRG
jgi:signal transduction histidine kinase/CheY-like chemotaxis protein/HPt (histidine-containing phosphotransfer) domain-containing protein